MNKHITAKGFYRGWRIYQNPQSGSQTWKANRFGVEMCANTQDLIVSMIDHRENDKTNPFRSNRNF